MKGLIGCLACTIVMAFASLAEARDTKRMISIEEAMSTPDAQARLNQGVQFFFGSQGHAQIEQSFGTFTSNKKTNALNKSDREACLWVFLSAMLSFQQRALSEGGNAVVGIRSYYRKNEIDSPTEFECGAGTLMAGVTFVGEVVRLAD